MSFDRYFLTMDEIEHITHSLQDNSLGDFLSFAKIAEPHVLFPMEVMNDRLTVGVGNKKWEIGTCFSSNKTLKINTNRQKILSLNCGSFDANANLLRDEKRYNKLKTKLLDYTEHCNFERMHFQDFPFDQSLFDTFRDRGYTGMWIPNLIYSEGSLAKNSKSGLLSLSHKNQEDSHISYYISIHQANFPQFSQYTKGVQNRDLLMINCSLLQVEISTNSKTIWITTNTYISPFSRATDRLENIISTVQNIIKIKSKLQQKYPDYTIFERFTGDMNLYGVNSLFNFFGFKVNPWSFGLPLLSSIFTGRNIPNRRELRKLQIELQKNGYTFIPIISKQNQTIYIDVAKYVPRLLQPLFQNIHVGWQLDLCIIPETTQIEAIVDKHPFGDFDHSSLRTCLKSNPSVFSP